MRAAPKPAPRRRRAGLDIPSEPEGLLAVELCRSSREAAPDGLVFVAHSETRAERLVATLESLAPDLIVLALPPWDCLPYDRTSPSREVMGRRMATLHALVNADGPVLLVTTVDAALQRLAPRVAVRDCARYVRIGDALRAGEIGAQLIGAGYLLEERVDEPGEAAIRGEVIDLYPPAAAGPYRIIHDDGTVTGIRRYDPRTQLSLAEATEFLVTPASEVLLPPATERESGIEHDLPSHYDELENIFDYLPDAAVVLDPEIPELLGSRLEQVADAWHSRRLAGTRHLRNAAAPADLFLDEAEWRRILQGRQVIQLVSGGSTAAIPHFVTDADSSSAAKRFMRDRLRSGERVVLAARSERELRRLERIAPEPPHRAVDWASIPSRGASSMILPLERGFSAGGVTVIAAADVFPAAPSNEASGASAFSEVMLRPGDAVIHAEHGLGILHGTEIVELGDRNAELLVIEYARGAKLLVPVEEVDRLWRYGSAAGDVTLDRLGGKEWRRRHDDIAAQLAETARGLVQLAQRRERSTAPRLVPPDDAYRRFAKRFAYEETPDQARTIHEVLGDLASGRPMDRLVCGDVGFGKTEVALRAAAVAVLAGMQVAVVAPTTVLVRQHLEVFQSRFAGFGIDIVQLSRLAAPADAMRAKSRLADGSARIAIGTHALAGKDVRFKNLGLLIVDEEQRFGARQKDALRALGRSVHVLTMTATPIPRSLQLAIIGLQELSVIGTPPVRRHPVRSFVTPFDLALARGALLRERRRGGQSFVVCPRIADVEPLARRLREAIPELQIVVAHGKMPAGDIDAVMIDFAAGKNDVLLTTNIIESGLDVPAANTMLVWHPDRFGLTQLHQLRGRVGRGRTRASCYFLLDPTVKLGPATMTRLKELETTDRLGAGFAISAGDLDLRGAGDLLGADQAGHVKLIGLELYQEMFARAMAVARGRKPPEDWQPVVQLELGALIPASYVPADEIRIEIYRRVARASRQHELDALEAEIEDRFGQLPQPVENLMRIAGFRRRARQLGLGKIEAGERAIAISFRGKAPLEPQRISDAEFRDGRLIVARPSATDAERLAAVETLLDEFASVMS